MSSRPSAELRRKVYARANGRCEYCLVHEDDAYATYQIDHVIAAKHSGATTLDNLALACMFCNIYKGSDISSVDPDTGQVVPLFNPRTQRWRDHFVVEGWQIVGLTPEGRATVVLLRLNAHERILERGELIRAGRYSM